MKPLQPAKHTVLRDLTVPRTAERGASGHYRFAGLFDASHGIPLALQRNFFEGGTDVGMQHGDDFYSLYLVRGGKGVQYLDDHPYIITRGDVYIVPIGMPHGFRDFEAVEMDGYYFQASLFTRAELAVLRQMLGFWQLFVPYRPAAMPAKRNSQGGFIDHRLHLTPEQCRQAEEMNAEMRREIDDLSGPGPQVARGLFFRLLVTLARWHEGAEPKSQSGRRVSRPRTHLSPSHANSAGISEAVRYCESNFQNDISTAQLASRAFLSPDHFTCLFTAQVGVTPAAYVRRLRLEHAQALLRTTTLEVGEIAEQTGFGGVAQLSRNFRAAFEMSPTHYRASFRRRGVR